MKSIILSFLVTLAITSPHSSIHAQTVAQGAWTFGGSVGFSSSKQEGAGNATTVIELLPEAGYFVIDDLGVGLNAIYSKTSQNNASFTEFGLGPWARYYVYQNVFAQASFLAESFTINGDFGKAKTTGTKMEGGIGYSAWLADAVALEPMAYFHLLKSKDENETPVNNTTFGLRIGLKIFIGTD